MLTKRRLPTDGSAGPFPIGMSYLDGSTLHVYRLDGLLAEPVEVGFTFFGTKSANQPQGSSIVLTSPIGAGSYIEIAKEVDLVNPAITWGAGSELNISNLKRSSWHLLEVAQTAYDRASDTIQTVEGFRETIEQIDLLVPESLLDATAQIVAARNATQAARDEAMTVTAAVQTVIARMQVPFTLDFGDSASEATFTVTVPGLGLGTLVRVDQVALPVDGRDIDEYEMDSVVCTAYVSAANTITIFAKSITGPVHGKYSFALTY